MTLSAPTQVDSRDTQENHAGHRNKILVVAATSLGIVFITHLFLSGHAANRLHQTCAICRLNRVDYTSTITGRTRSRVAETSCSAWYREKSEDQHDHVWVRSPTVGLVNFYGQTIGVSDNDETPGRAIWLLSPNQQIEIYEHFDGRLEAKALFTALAHPEAWDDRADFSIVYSLRQWADSGFQRSWQAPVELRGWLTQHNH